jgi:hypothetical protein
VRYVSIDGALRLLLLGWHAWLLLLGLLGPGRRPHLLLLLRWCWCAGLHCTDRSNARGSRYSCQHWQLLRLQGSWFSCCGRRRCC